MSMWEFIFFFVLFKYAMRLSFTVRCQYVADVTETHPTISYTEICAN